MIGALVRRHGIDDGHDVRDLFFVDFDIFQIFENPHVGHHAQQRFQWAQLADLSDLIAKILECKIVFDQLALHLDGLLLIDGLLGLFD